MASMAILLYLAGLAQHQLGATSTGLSKTASAIRSTVCVLGKAASR